MPTKNNLSDLAIFGGASTSETALHVNEPWVGDRSTFDSYVDQIWKSRRLTNDGPLVRQLERELERRLDVEHCILMTNGTVALSLLLQVLDIRGEVIFPSFTFISTLHVLLNAGIRPVFCDVAPGDWNIDVDHCRRLVNGDTTAIIPTHLWGRPCAVDELEQVAADHDLRLIFDAAHAFGCSYKGQSIGGFGDAEVFSLHGTKSFQSAEGGAITCGDPALADLLRRARNFGFAGADHVEGIGTNAKMSELHAALGLTNLEHFDDNLIHSRAVYDAYYQRLDGLSHVTPLRFDHDEANNYWYVAVELAAECAIDRDDVLRIMVAENILARRYFYPGSHRMAPSRLFRPDLDDDLPNTMRIAGSILLLPAGPAVSLDDVDRVCDVLDFVVSRSEEIAARLGVS